MRTLIALASFALISCGPADGSPPPPATGGSPSLPATGGSSALPSTGGSSALPSTGGSPSEGGTQAEVPNPLGRYRCKAPEGSNPSPQTIQETVDLLNALPKPTSVACFVESLARPLTITATTSQSSAQPAGSATSPRIFIRLGQLWLSVVIDGISTDLLEFGYLLPNTYRSIKAELHLPIEAALTQSAPFERPMYDEIGTVCRLCHRDEQPEELLGLPNVFSSRALKPRPETLIPIETLALAAQTCNWQTEPHRCEMLAAIFASGPVLQGTFPDSMETFF
ncbi:MAG TPA: hypothetical protein VG937_38505 [Polyangiaceae bacterium]|nr:hypothetical protein [Polyangiaceae bacterium]